MSVGWLLALGLLTIAAATVWAAAGWSATAERVTFRLQFPRALDVEALERLLTGWSGTLPPAWRRWVSGMPHLIMEVQAMDGRIEHYLHVSPRWASLVESLLTAHLPNVRYERVPAPELHVTHAAQYRSTTSHRPLAIDAEGLAAGLLAATQPLRPDEAVVVQVILGPHSPVEPPHVRSDHTLYSWLNPDGSLVDSAEAAAAQREKQKGALLVSVNRLGVHAPSADRAHSVLRRLEAPWHGTRAPGVHLRREWLPKWFVARRMNNRVTPGLSWTGGALNAHEAAGLSAWPIGIEQLPGLQLGGCRLLPVPGAVPSVGTVIGEGTFPSTQRPVALGLEARMVHGLVIGPTGSGKTVFLSRLALSDMADPNRAVVVVDVKDGGLVDRILEAAPANRLDDVIVFDPADPSAAAGFDPIACTPESRELVVDQFDANMRETWGATNYGPRSSDLVRHAVRLLTQVEGMTLVEAPRLLADPTFRRSLLAQVDDPLVTGSFWAWFDGLSTAEQATIAAPALNKLRSLTSREYVRHAIGQSSPSIDFRRIINNHGVLLVRLSSGLLGEATAGLLGAALLTQLWQAITARAALAPQDRKPAMVIIDEAQAVLRLSSDAVEEMLVQARGYGVGVTLAHQHLTQLSSDVRETALANTRSKIIFACSNKDATTFARELGSTLTADDLREIEAHEAVASIYAEGRVQPPTTIKVLPPAEPIRSAEEVKSRSRQRYGTDRKTIEADIRRRQNLGSDNGTGEVGRKRRGA